MKKRLRPPDDPSHMNNQPRNWRWHTWLVVGDQRYLMGTHDTKAEADAAAAAPNVIVAENPHWRAPD